MSTVVYHIPAPDMDDKQIALVRSEKIKIVNIDLPAINTSTTVEKIADTLSKSIKGRHPVLLGFCYGGLLAQELVKKIPQARVIAVSTITHKKEVSTKHKALARIFYYSPDIFLQGLGQSIAFLVNQVMRIQVKIPRIWLKISQNKFIVEHALNFQGIDRQKIFRIHGDRDAIVPADNLLIDKVISPGGHFMFWNHRKEVLAAIEDAAIHLCKAEAT